MYTNYYYFYVDNYFMTIISLYIIFFRWTFLLCVHFFVAWTNLNFEVNKNNIYVYIAYFGKNIYICDFKFICLQEGFAKIFIIKANLHY